MTKRFRIIFCALVFLVTLFSLLTGNDTPMGQSMEGACEACEEAGHMLKCPGITPDKVGFSEGNCIRVVFTPQMVEGEALPCFTTYFFNCNTIQSSKPDVGCPILNFNKR